MNIKFLIAVLFILFTAKLTAQALIDFNEEEIEQDFLYNINLYSGKYIAPVIDGYGLNLTTGWQTTAKTLQPFAFSVGAQAASTFIKSDDLQFNFNDVAFSDNLKLKNPNDQMLPTALGGSTGQQFIYEAEGRTAFGTTTYQDSFPALSGITAPFNAIPSMGLLVGVGLPLDFEVSFRFFPPINIEDVLIQQYGGGVKHKISRYFLEKESKFNVSAAAFYNFSKFRFEPTEFLEGENQKIVFTDKTLNLEGIASFDTKFLSIFATLGYYATTTEFGILGTYTFEVNEGALVQEAFSATDPVEITQKNNNIKYAGGVAFKLSHFAELGVSYQFAEYGTLATTLRVNFRNGED